MHYQAIEYVVGEKGIGILSLNRPEKYNALSQQMLEELENFWLARQQDLETNIIVLKGNGEKGFCAGLDLEAFMGMASHITTEQFYAYQSRMGRLMLLMRQAPQPIICAIHGAAVGIGFSFALASDVRVMSRKARLSAGYINVGFGGADMACSYLLPRLIGAGRANELMLTGDFISSEEAMNLGLISQVVEREMLVETAMGIAEKMSGKNPMGLRLTKAVMNVNLDAGGLEQALNMEDRNQTLLFAKSMLDAARNAG